MDYEVREGVLRLPLSEEIDGGRGEINGGAVGERGNQRYPDHSTMTWHRGYRPQTANMHRTQSTTIDSAYTLSPTSNQKTIEGMLNDSNEIFLMPFLYVLDAREITWLVPSPQPYFSVVSCSIHLLPILTGIGGLLKDRQY